MSMGIPKDLLELTILSFSSGRELWSPWVFLDHSLPNTVDYLVILFRLAHITARSAAYVI